MARSPVRGRELESPGRAQRGPRDRALGNAVIRVASELLLEEGIVSPPGSSWPQVLGDDRAVEYASRLPHCGGPRAAAGGVDRGIGPDATEYVVVVRGRRRRRESPVALVRAAGCSRSPLGGRRRRAFGQRLQALGVLRVTAPIRRCSGAVRGRQRRSALPVEMEPNSFSESRMELRVDTRDVCSRFGLAARRRTHPRPPPDRADPNRGRRIECARVLDSEAPLRRGSWGRARRSDPGLEAGAAGRLTRLAEIGIDSGVLRKEFRHVAQWLERRLDTAEVGGSTPPVPTTAFRASFDRDSVRLLPRDFDDSMHRLSS